MYRNFLLILHKNRTNLVRCLIIITPVMFVMGLSVFLHKTVFIEILLLGCIDIYFLYHNKNLKTIKNNIILLFFPVALAFFECINYTEFFGSKYHLIRNCLYWGMIPFCINEMLCLFVKNKYVRVIFTFLLHCVCVLPYLFLFFIFVYKIRIDNDLILAICQTDSNEIKNLFIHSFSYFFIIFIVVILLSFLFFLETKRETKPIVKNEILLIASCFIFLLYFYPSRIPNTPYFIKTIINFYSSIDDFRTNTQKNDKYRQYLRKNTAPNIAIIIGESESACSINSETAPWRTNMQSNTTFIKFDNVFANYTHTVPSLSYALSSFNQYDNQIHKEENLFKDISISAELLPLVLMKCGYHTIWISNQMRIGLFDTPISLIGALCNKNKFIKEDEGVDCFDIALLPYISETNNAPNCVFMHLQGSHFPYLFDHSTRKEKLSAYENTIWATDNFLKIASEKLFSNGTDIIIYFSDHGEDPQLREHGHNIQFINKYMIKVPLFIYISNEYAKQNPDIVHKIENARHSYITNDLIFNLICHICNIESEWLSSELDPLSDDYKIKNAQMAKTAHGKYTVKEILIKK